MRKPEMLSNLDEREWREYFLKDIFTAAQRGKRLTKVNQILGEKPYISSTSQNNGVDNFISNNYGVRIFSDCLTIANSGSVGATFYHPYKFIASDHVTHLKNSKFNSFIYFFIAAQINRLSEKYNFNREINDKRISREKVMLPISGSGSPDYEFMTQYIQNILDEKKSKYVEYCKLQLTKLSYKEIESLSDKKWDEFFIEDIASINSGRDIYEAERIDGNTPYISATAQRNGVGYFVDNINHTLEKNCISVNRNGSVGYSFYHPYNALFSNDCRKLKLNVDSKHIGFFIANQITLQRSKYNYGYKMGTGRLKRQKIMLPVCDSGKPDYEYMHQYMVNLEIIKRKQYLSYLNSSAK